MHGWAVVFMAGALLASCEQKVPATAVESPAGAKPATAVQPSGNFIAPDGKLVNVVNGSAAQATDSLYKVIVKLQPTGVPDAAARAQLKPWITPALAKLLDEAGAVEDKRRAGNNQGLPLVSGSLFTSDPQGATSYMVGGCDGDDKARTCLVLFTLKTANGAKRWRDDVMVVRDGDIWRIDDIGYARAKAKGRLSAKLRDVMAKAGP